jgi:ParB family chromosome partitioning protein
MKSGAKEAKNTNSAVTRTILLSEISPSNSAIQARRRSHFTDVDTDELAASIKSNGLIQPITVRSNTWSDVDKRKFEIVCGERRYLATKKAGFDSIDAIVRDLSDVQLLEIQATENLQRKNIDPIDEAWAYKELQEKLGYDVKELALRFGKSETYILGRIKLNQLIPEVQKDIEDGYLSLTLGLEIAKYGIDGQREIYKELYEQGDWDGKAQTWLPDKEFLELRKPADIARWAQNNILRVLAKAPFDINSTQLRPDGIACVTCPDRTGANVGLFSSEQVGKKDACLDPGCYKAKTGQFVQLKREDLRNKQKLPSIDKVPIVNTTRYSDDEGYIGYDSFKLIGSSGFNGSKAKCESSVKAIDVSSENFGKTVEVCFRSSACKTHHKKISSGSTPSASPRPTSSAEPDEKRLEDGRKRREEIFNSKVAEETRRRVFVEASKAFAPKFQITAPIAGFLPALINRLYEINNYEITNSVKDLCKRSGIKEKPDAPEDLARVLFFFLHCSAGKIDPYGNYFKPQTEVKKIAADYSVNYPLIDAAVRRELAPKKHQKAHQIYFNLIEAGGKKAIVPRLFTDNWKEKV